MVLPLIQRIAKSCKCFSSSSPKSQRIDLSKASEATKPIGWHLGTTPGVSIIHWASLGTTPGVMIIHRECLSGHCADAPDVTVFFEPLF